MTTLSDTLSEANRPSLTIDGKTYGAQHPCLIIGEIAQAHDGSLGMAHSYIDAIAAAGADAVKFQTHIASAESTEKEPWRVRFSPQDDTRMDYWRRMEFTPEQWKGLEEHAREKGLLFLSSPFSPEAVQLLKKIGIKAWKIASGEVTNPTLMDPVLATKLPVLLSTGMSSLQEIDTTVETICKAGSPLGVFQCTSMYPVPPEKVGLNMISFFRERYGCAAGLSDHSGTMYPGLAAAALGLDMLEIHVTFSREMFGPDVPASVTTGEFKQLIEGIRTIERMRENPLAKDDMLDTMQPLRSTFTKSVVAAHPLRKGTVLTPQDLAAKKPGCGIPAHRIPELTGLVLARDVDTDHFFDENDFEDHA